MCEGASADFLVLIHSIPSTNWGQTNAGVLNDRRRISRHRSKVAAKVRRLRLMRMAHGSSLTRMDQHVRITSKDISAGYLCFGLSSHLVTGICPEHESAVRSRCFVVFIAQKRDTHDRFSCYFTPRVSACRRSHSSRCRARWLRPASISAHASRQRNPVGLPRFACGLVSTDGAGYA